MAFPTMSADNSTASRRPDEQQALGEEEAAKRDAKRSQPPPDKQHEKQRQRPQKPGEGAPGAKALRNAMRDGSGRPRPDAIRPNRAQQSSGSASSARDPEEGLAPRPYPPKKHQRAQVLSARDVVASGADDDGQRRQARGEGRPQAPSSRPASAQDATAIRSRIKDLEFVDMYVPMHNHGVARYNPKNVRLGEPGNIPVGKEYRGDLSALRERLQHIPKEDFSVVHDDVRYRGSKAALANGEQWVCLRRISGDVPTLEKLRIDPILLPKMRDLGRRNGLVIVCGGTGQGKSTTATALLADYLNRIGHVAMTIEDPVEFNLHGERGNGGYCFQVEGDDEEAWAPALKRALRWHPRYILVGEVRSGAAAAQMLRAATSGHLVIATFHAGSVEKGIQSIIQVAESEVGARAQDLVAEGLAAVFHQTITPSGPEISYLFTDPSGSDPARQYIRSGKLHMLNSYMEQQAVRMANEAAGKNPDGTYGRQS